MNTMIKACCILFILGSISPILHAQSQSCAISNVTTQHLVLRPQQHNSSNVAFSIQCAHHYSITFSNANHASSEGIGHLRHHQNNIRTKMSARSDQMLPWAVPVQQNAHQQHNYVITASVLDPITAITPAGVYRDRIQLRIEF